MWRPTPDELNEILRKHLNWLNSEDDGECADLRYADLRHCSLAHANLSRANLYYANLYGIDLSYADLSYARMNGTHLSNANLSGADFSFADLIAADMRYADLDGADLRGANIHYAHLSDAKNIDSILWDVGTAFYQLQCPESGSFIGYKKAHGIIIKLEICEDALRSSATSRKCRCSKARVLGFEHVDGTPIEIVTRISSDHDHTFTYEVGKIVEVPNFDTDRWNECAPGIHFFVTREEAVKYTG